MPKAFISIMEYDYGVKSRGYSYEYYNIYLPVCDLLGEENVYLFDYYSEFKSSGRQGMNKKLKEIILAEKPDFALFCLFEMNLKKPLFHLSGTLQKRFPIL